MQSGRRLRVLGKRFKRSCNSVQFYPAYSLSSTFSVPGTVVGTGVKVIKRQIWTDFG